MEKRRCSKHPDTEAVIYCSHSDCDKFLCAECEEEHNGIASVDHRDYVVRNIKKGNALVSKCENHPKHPQNFLCKIHWVLCCSECTKDGGAHHKCSVCPLNNIKIKNMEKDLLEAERTYIDERDKLCGSPLSNLETKIENFHKEVDEKRESLINYFDKLKITIEQRESELLGKLEEISESENELTDFIADINEEDESLLNHEDIESAPSEVRKRKIARRIGRMKEETKKLKAKFVKALDYLAESTEILTIFNDSVPGLISSADVKLEKKVGGFRVMKTGATISEISLHWTLVQAENALYQLEMTNTAINEQTYPYTGKGISFKARNLEPNTTYSFRVRPRINDTYGNWSDAIAIRTEPLGVPQNFKVNATGCDKIQASWNKTKYATSYHLEMKRKIDTDFKEVFKRNVLTFTEKELSPDTEYLFRVRARFEGGRYSAWSKELTARTKDTKDTQKLPRRYAWKSCPPGLRERKKYQVSDTNSRIATNAYANGWCTILGREPIQRGKTVGYGVKILNSTFQCEGIYIGVTHRGIDQGADENFNKRGWYLHCYDSTLWSGPPHNYRGENYGPKKGIIEHINVGDTVGVVMDTAKGELSFVVKGANLGVAYEGIPLDKPFIPCVILRWIDDSVELDLFVTKENVDSSVPVPNVETENITWDSIMVSWSAVEGAQFYQVEKNLVMERSTTKKHAIYNEVKPGEECKFRVRAIVGNRVSEWSDFVRAKGQHESFKLSKWMEYKSIVIRTRGYCVDKKDNRVATKTSNEGYYCTIIGSTPIPLKGGLSSWSVKILKSKNNNGGETLIGVAPLDIDQNAIDNYSKCGWYFYCGNSSLYSGPPHNYKGKEYGPRRENGQYVYTGDSVGVVVDTAKRNLSFVLNNVNHGVAYDGIPLDEPLVPCVLLYNNGDSVKLVTSGAKENVDNSIPVPSNITTKSETTWDTLTLTWDKVTDASFYQVEVDGSKSWDSTTENKLTWRGFLPETEHCFRVRTAKSDSVSKWSNIVKGRTLKKSFETSWWKECPGSVGKDGKYSVDWNSPRTAAKVANGYCTIIGNTPISFYTVTSWSVNILKSRDNNGGGICIGVAPSDINQNEKTNTKCGWYLYCYRLALCSGPPHNYVDKEYMSWGKYGQYVRTGDSVGVVMDTTKGNLSFVVDGVNHGVAYRGIPLDKPLVPCVLLKYDGDSVELDTSEVKENVDSSIHVPSNITTKSGITWDTLTLTWNNVSDALFYQIEVDGSKLWFKTTENKLKLRGFLPDTEHSFRVRMIKGNLVSEWSGVVKGRTPKKSFETGWWKKCPESVVKDRKYSVDWDNPKIVTKSINSGEGNCTIIWNAPVYLNTATSWSIKLLESKKNNNGGGINIGIAPFDINQNDDNYTKCGWYFSCCSSTLFSGPPHNYWSKEYGPRKGNGQYVHTGDSVGIIIDTIKGDLSFVLNNANLGVAYEGIPLDKPLVPCVLLKEQGDSVELDPSEVKENVSSTIPIPSNITAKSITWDTITLTWGKLTNASFYQVEVDGSKSWDVTTENKLTWEGFLPDTEHSFRVRTIKGNLVSRWSGVVKGRTPKKSFESSWWMKCPESVVKDRKYSVDWENPRIATSASNDFFGSFYGCYRYCCTIIGNTPIPLNKVTSWSIKILKSKNSDGHGIFIGAASSAIDQNDDSYNNFKCGWYFHCYSSTLWSGPPHNYDDKEYGPKKGFAMDDTRTEGSVGVVMDTTKGELSFVVKGVSLGVAYGGILLDKPLAPCVLLKHQGDSVEFDTSEVKENKVDSSIPIPSNITTSIEITWDTITLAWDKVANASFYQVEVDGNKSWHATTTSTFTKRGLLPDTEHSFRVRTVRRSSVSEWSSIVKTKIKRTFKGSWWKECPESVDKGMKYRVNKENSRIATNVNGGYCTIIGNTSIPLNTVTSWIVKNLKSLNNDGNSILIGVAPSDINQNIINCSNRGWYFDCYYSSLRSGPPHNYWCKEYGPRKEKDGQYVPTGYSVGVVMDTTKGDLSFVVNGVNLGVAYEGIPLDKPLVPCVILRYRGDSVELDISEANENVSNSIPVPSNITTKSETTWDTITLTWDKVIYATFYQVEVDGSKSWYATTENKLTWERFLPETEHSFRVRTIKRSSVSEWSSVVKTKIEKTFKGSWWKEYSESVDKDITYNLNKENSRIATKVNNNGYYCTIIGNTPIPPNAVTSWSTKVLKSLNNDGNSIYIGVAPSDINLDGDDNYNYCGWYFYCFDSTLFSGPPHNYRKEYGQRKAIGQYVHTGDSVGVVMDTAKGDLSFILNGVNLGVAYGGIPHDKPLVPCVILKFYGDSIELDTSEVKENVNSFIPIPFNITTKSGSTWDTLTLTWDKVLDASFYQVEMDGNKTWYITTANKLTWRGFLPETEHSFRVRLIKGSSASEWSSVVKTKIEKTFKGSWWKECPDDVDKNMKYNVNKENSRIATKVNNNGYYCTIIGNTPIPLNTMASWGIKVLKSLNNDGNGIYVGVAPSDINQGVDGNYKCGWHFDCYCSVLYSGPPHNYKSKEFKSKAAYGQYVHTGDSVGVVMDTTKGDLSFVLNNANLGVAYERIPLDKPLVPCVLLKEQGDSVELDFSEENLGQSCIIS